MIDPKKPNEPAIGRTGTKTTTDRVQSQDWRRNDQDKNRNNKHIENKCNLPGYKGHEWVDCRQNTRNRSNNSNHTSRNNGSHSSRSSNSSRNNHFHNRRQENNHVRSSGNRNHTRPSERGRSCNIDHTRSSRRNRSASNGSSSTDGSSYGSCSYSSEHFNIEAVDEPSNTTPKKGSKIFITLPATDTAPKRTFLALFDSGTSSSLINYDKVCKHATNKVKSNTSWITQAAN